MLSIEDIEPGIAVVHKNTGLRYAVVDVSKEEVLLSPESDDDGLQDLMVPVTLFCEEFVGSERYAAPRRPRARGRRPASAARATPTGPKVRGRVKKLVPERGFGFVRGDDGKEVFFHRSGLGPNEYDSLSEGDLVEYVVQEGPRGPRAENVRMVVEGQS
jgi:CspA family cold shock protein